MAFIVAGRTMSEQASPGDSCWYQWPGLWCVAFSRAWYCGPKTTVLPPFCHLVQSRTDALFAKLSAIAVS